MPDSGRRKILTHLADGRMEQDGRGMMQEQYGATAEVRVSNMAADDSCPTDGLGIRRMSARHLLSLVARRSEDFGIEAMYLQNKSEQKQSQ